MPARAKRQSRRRRCQRSRSAGAVAGRHPPDDVPGLLQYRHETLAACWQITRRECRIASARVRLAARGGLKVVSDLLTGAASLKRHEGDGAGTRAATSRP